MLSDIELSEVLGIKVRHRCTKNTFHAIYHRWLRFVDVRMPTEGQLTLLFKHIKSPYCRLRCINAVSDK